MSVTGKDYRNRIGSGMANIHYPVAIVVVPYMPLPVFGAKVFCQLERIYKRCGTVVVRCHMNDRRLHIDAVPQLHRRLAVAVLDHKADLVPARIHPKHILPIFGIGIYLPSLATRVHHEEKVIFLGTSSHRIVKICHIERTKRIAWNKIVHGIGHSELLGRNLISCHYAIGTFAQLACGRTARCVGNCEHREKSAKLGIFVRNRRFGGMHRGAVAKIP